MRCPSFFCCGRRLFLRASDKGAIDLPGSAGPRVRRRVLARGAEIRSTGPRRLVPFGVSVAPYVGRRPALLAVVALEAYPLNTLEAMSRHSGGRQGGPPQICAADTPSRSSLPLGGLRRPVQFLSRPEHFFVPRFPRGCQRASGGSPRARGCGKTEAMRDAVAAPAAARFATGLRAAFSFRRSRPLVSFVVRTYWARWTPSPLRAAEDLALRRCRS